MERLALSDYPGIMLPCAREASPAPAAPAAPEAPEAESFRPIGADYAGMRGGE